MMKSSRWKVGMGAVFALAGVLASALAAHTSFATVKRMSLGMKLELDGKTFAQPNIEFDMNEKATVKQYAPNEGVAYKVEVSADELSEGRFRLDFSLFKITTAGSKLLGTPKLVVTNHQTASVEEKERGGGTLKLTVTPNL
jgi:hypothetical protein